MATKRLNGNGAVEQVSAVHYSFPDDLTYEQWAEVLGALAVRQRACPFHLGDALVFGERHYGEQFSNASVITGLRPKTLVTYHWVASRILPERREATVEFSIHRMLAKFDVGVQREFLRRAAAAEWTVGQCRRALIEAGLIEPGEQRDVMAQFRRLWERATLDERSQMLAYIEGQIAASVCSPSRVASVAVE